LKFEEIEFGEMKRNTSNWSNFCMLLRRAGFTASAGLSCISHLQLDSRTSFNSWGMRIIEKRTELQIKKYMWKYRSRNRNCDNNNNTVQMLKSIMIKQL